MEVGFVERIAHERFARDDRAWLRTDSRRRVGVSQAIDARDLEAARIAPTEDLVPLTGAVEVDAADLKAVTRRPDPVEHRAMPLIIFRQRSFTAKVLCDRKCDLLEAAQGKRIAIPESRQRVGQRPLPAMAQALGDVHLEPVIV